MWKGAAAPTTITIDRYYDGDNIQQLVARGNAAGVPILISIGGWTGSQTFSTVAASAAYRKTWINNALVFVRQNTNGNDAENPNGWGMDGIDIDWYVIIFFFFFFIVIFAFVKTRWYSYCAILS